MSLKLFKGSNVTVIIENNIRYQGAVTANIDEVGESVSYQLNGRKIFTYPWNQVFKADGVTVVGSTADEVQAYNDLVFKTASGGSGAGTNPTSGLIPYNSGGSFVDTSIEIGSAFGSPTYKFKDSTIVSATYFTDTFLNMDYSVDEYSFGKASFSGGIPSADIGMAMTGMRMVIGMNMQGGTDGVIRANGNTGVVSIGAFGVEYALGVNPFGGGVLIGSGFIDTIPPANSTVPAVWINITNESGVQYKIAGYQ
jgi:hypothetical protein